MLLSVELNTDAGTLIDVCVNVSAFACLPRFSRKSFWFKAHANAPSANAMKLMKRKRPATEQPMKRKRPATAQPMQRKTLRHTDCVKTLFRVHAQVSLSKKGGTPENLDFVLEVCIC